ncbi:MAG: zf-HC2 domain-containing protein [Terracidiphilus sp.]
MSRCSAVRAKFLEYLDGRMTGREMQRVSAHVDGCIACLREWTALRQNQSALAALGPVAAPEDMALRIRVAVSRERARRSRGSLAGMRLAWRNTVGPFLLQAAAGFASAVLLLGSVTFMVGMFTQPEAAHATKDVPLGNATSPRLLYFLGGASSDEIDASPGPVVVEAYVNSEGTVYDYRIVAGPNDAATRAEVENVLVLSRFEPARFFGQPVRGLAVLSFSGVSVRG